jgi:hypothetical protein
MLNQSPDLPPKPVVLDSVCANYTVYLGSPLCPQPLWEWIAWRFTFQPHPRTATASCVIQASPASSHWEGDSGLHIGHLLQLASLRTATESFSTHRAGCHPLRALPRSQACQSSCHPSNTSSLSCLWHGTVFLLLPLLSTLECGFHEDRDSPCSLWSYQSLEEYLGSSRQLMNILWMKQYANAGWVILGNTSTSSPKVTEKEVISVDSKETIEQTLLLKHFSKQPDFQNQFKIITQIIS